MRQPQIPGEPLMEYPKKVHPFDPIWHYPDCAPHIAWEDNDCPYCTPIRILAEEAEYARELFTNELWSKHAEGWAMLYSGKSVIDIHDEYYEPSSEIRNLNQYKLARNAFNAALKARIKEVDEYWAKWI